ncbi:MAG TPA: kelch repeat-containing protein [Ignavibacteria bacterium]|nr:kelch repeat-containing protein [Ignavibacteria bacterium]
MKNIKRMFFLSFSTLLLAVFGFKHYNSDIITTVADSDLNGKNEIVLNGDNGGSWVSGPNLPIGPRYYSAYCTYTRNDTSWLFVLGGDTTGSGHPTRTSFKYNFRTNQWSQIAPMPIPLRTHTAAVIGDTVYTFGGLDSPTSNGVSSILKYNINSNTWTSGPNLPSPIFFSGVTVLDNKYAFIAGGVTSTTTDNLPAETSLTGVYNAIAGLFRENNSMPLEAAAMYLAHILDPKSTDNVSLYKVFCIGGFKTGSVPSSDVLECNVDPLDSNNTTYIVHSNIIPGGGLARHTGVTLPDGRVLVSGGVRTNSFNAISNHYIFNPYNITFSSLPSSIFPICAHSSGVAKVGNEYKFMTTGGITTGPTLTAQSQFFMDSILIGITPISSEIPVSMQLHQNYPNPFNPVTKIRFEVSEAASDVKLTVYDIQGREVSNVINNRLSAGIYEYTFEANNLPSGIYFYRLQTGNISLTRKMMLVK